MTSVDKRGELREVEGAAQTTGLVIYRASRLEMLLGPLRELLNVTRPANILAPQTIIAAHPGMKHWLNGALARAYGPGGIVANLDIQLPSTWIGNLAERELGQQAVSLPRYQREHLRWNIHELLGGGLEAIGVTDARIASYLQPGEADRRHAGADLARRRFQLADRLARIYSQYVVYRPDWLDAWEDGRLDAVTGHGGDPRIASTEQRLLAPLWRQLHAQLGPHRGDVVAALIDRLHNHNGAVDEALHVFGVSHLAPSELAVIRAAARHRLVAMYVPDPCREYWGGLGNTVAQIQQRRVAEQAGLESAGAGDYWIEQENPLLASWGRMGQHFIMALADGTDDVLADVRHRADEDDSPPVNRLQRVQESIRALAPLPEPVDLQQPAVIEREIADASLRVHASHTRLRELEILRDQLLDAIESTDQHGDPIRPADIVVMAPDIRSYVPLIPAVFGVAGHGGGRLPYHLADVSVARSHSLFGAFQRLLDLPGTRVTAPEVVDLLTIPEVAARLGLDSAAVNELSGWLQASRVAWALDPAFRSRFGVPAIAEHTFGWAMDRMMAGYLMADGADSDHQGSVELPDGLAIAPLTGIHGPAAAHLGALDYLLREIQALCDLAEESRPASAWAEELERRFEAMFRIDLMDANARDARAALLGFIRMLATETAKAEVDPGLHFSVVRDLLVERLAAAPERQRFLMGGVTFCGMVPQRAIPFKVVAVLGLNDGEFPRNSSDAGLDLMARYRRLGDRDVRSDDRYLFLETLMSARERLHLSYLGEGVVDGKPRNPAQPLSELLAVLDASAGLAADDTDTPRPWIIRHPLQPFDARYYDGSDPQLFSYQQDFAAMHAEGARPNVAPFLDRNGAGEVVVEGPVALREVQSYYRDPAAQVLGRRMQISLDALVDDRLPSEEPVDPRFGALDSVPRKLFFNDALPAWPHGQWPPDRAPDWLRLGGMMPPGQPGLRAWEDSAAAVGKLLERLADLPAFEHGVPAPVSVVIDQAVGDVALVGQVGHVYRVRHNALEHWQILRAFPGKDGALKAEKDLDFKDRVPMFMDWALLRLHTAVGSDPLPTVRLAMLVDDGIPNWSGALNAWDDAFVKAGRDERAQLIADLQQRLVRLLQWWMQAQGRPRWYFPKIAWEAIQPTLNRRGGGSAEGDQDPAPANVEGVWVATHGGTGERDYSPGYSRLLAGAVDFAGGSDELAELHAFALALHECIDMASPLRGDASTDQPACVGRQQ
ncbi:exodeoxyribonuclease V subunit gamma [Lysobacter sp. A03]|uniref:exodeoxyribonuclease V subunit gamma n=1 Tax=Lysobacter sp. A03 TaxID=1199154 RepID=UPI001364AB0E|nr:exodeoxyribonuclease V subunit gamma [Lysobacter sp. A03]